MTYFYNRQSFFLLIICLALAAFHLFFPAPLVFAENMDQTLPVIEFTTNHRDTAKEVARTLEKHHYSQKKLNNEMSDEILSIYIKHLDPSKQLFTQKDLKWFDKHKYNLDNYLSKGDLSFAKQAFDLYLVRNEQRLNYMLELIKDWKTRLDFTMDDTLATDTKEKPFEPSMASLQVLWEKYIKDHILTFKLNDKSDREITEELDKIYSGRLNRLYQTDSQDAFELFINAVATGFDPHSQFMPPRASEDFDIHMSLSLEGIGAVLQTEYDYTKVVRIIPAGPADKSKQLMPGDKIIGVGQGPSGEIKDILGQRIENVVRMIRGPRDTVVRLKIIPAKDTTSLKTINIKREKVKLEEQSARQEVVTVSDNGKPSRIGVITIPAFYLDFNALNAGNKDYRSTTKDVQKLLFQLKDEQIDGLIIDLRNNGGGALQEASLLTGLFIETGPTVQIKTRYRVQRLYDDDPAILYTGPLMVIINRMSASASEIFAGAIKDYNRGIVIGTQSFGKGTVQSLQELNKGKLKMTSAKFYRVSGESTQKRGIIPDITFPPVYHSDRIGESALDGTLPWDTTRRARFSAYPDLKDAVALLKKHFDKRAENEPGLIYLKERFKLGQQMTGQKTVSLNEQVRKDRQAELTARQLEIENRYNKATGKPLLEKLPDEEDEDTADEDQEPDDIIKNEAQALMALFIRHSSQQGLTW